MSKTLCRRAFTTAVTVSAGALFFVSPAVADTAPTSGDVGCTEQSTPPTGDDVGGTDGVVVKDKDIVKDGVVVKDKDIVKDEVVVKDKENEYQYKVGVKEDPYETGEVVKEKPEKEPPTHWYEEEGTVIEVTVPGESVEYDAETPSNCGGDGAGGDVTTEENTDGTVGPFGSLESLLGPLQVSFGS